MKKKLSLVFMVGPGRQATVDLIAEVMAVQGIEIAMILSESPRVPLKRRVRNLVNNTEKNGVGYLPYRLLTGISRKLESLNDNVVSKKSVLDLARRAFPDKPFTLDDFSRLHDIPVRYVDSMNGEEAIGILTSGSYDLGVVLGTGILKKYAFDAPRLGSINIHKGKVPEYRGMPSGFWELYDKALTASVTIHKVEAGLDTGDVHATRAVDIHPKETLSSVQRKLDASSIVAVKETLSAIVSGTASPKKQGNKTVPARTTPTLAIKREAVGFTGQQAAVRSLLFQVLRGFYTFVLFRLGIPNILRRMRQKNGKPRGVILLYHRIDSHKDNLSIDLLQFIRHMLILKKSYTPITLEQSYEIAKDKSRMGSDCFCITFDDCYKSVHDLALPVLDQLGIKGALFVSTGFIGKDREFLHDEQYPVTFENMTEEDVRGAHERGHTIAAHTVNHVNLGATDVGAIKEECTLSRKRLQEITGDPIPFFSFPFGRRQHISAEALKGLEETGVTATFSAYGGTLNSTNSVMNIERLGISGKHSASSVVLDYEGVSILAIKANK